MTVRFDVERSPIMASGQGVNPQKEINRLKVQARRLEKDRDKLYPDLGRQAYGAFLEGRLSDPGLIEACESVKVIDDQVGQLCARANDLKAQIERMKAVPPPAAVCPSCGTPAGPGVRFCGSCGGAIAQPAPPPCAAPAACPSCSSPAVEGARFCPACGMRFPGEGPAPTAEAVPPPAAPPPPLPAVTAPPSPPVAPPAPSPAPGSAPEEEEERKCPACDSPVEEADAIFCGECGSRLG